VVATSHRSLRPAPAWLAPHRLPAGSGAKPDMEKAKLMQDGLATARDHFTGGPLSGHLIGRHTWRPAGTSGPLKARQDGFTYDPSVNINSGDKVLRAQLLEANGGDPAMATPPPARGFSNVTVKTALEQVSSLLWQCDGVTAAVARAALWWSMRQRHPPACPRTMSTSTSMTVPTTGPARRCDDKLLLTIMMFNIKQSRLQFPERRGVAVMMIMCCCCARPTRRARHHGALPHHCAAAAAGWLAGCRHRYLCRGGPSTSSC